MNQGGYLTRYCLIAPVAKTARALGATVFPEHTVRLAQTVGYVDLRIDLGPVRIAAEAELGTKPLDNDLLKAIALPAHLLLVLVPNWSSCKKARQAMARILERRRRNGLTAPTDPVILILPVGPARQQLGQINDFVSRSLSDLSQNPKIIPASLARFLAGSTRERSKS